jgi:hypothetical protein
MSLKRQNVKRKAPFKGAFERSGRKVGNIELI